jgi:hypothetical protein
MIISFLELLPKYAQCLRPDESSKTTPYALGLGHGFPVFAMFNYITMEFNTMKLD